MTQEDKNKLLLQDLCARLPYQPLCKKVDTEDDFCECDAPLGYSLRDLADNKIIIKPYLRPMSSMTEEEIEIYRIIIKSLLENSVTNNVATLYNFLNSKHLDYNSLIYFGLAIEVTEENNPYENPNS